MKKRKIYVASSWSNIDQPVVISILKALGHEVYDFRHPTIDNSGFSWDEIDQNWHFWSQSEYLQALENPIAKKAFKLDFEAMQWADTCVMVLPCGQSANTEAGWMKGMGKEVFVYQPIRQEPELMYKIYDKIFINSESLINHFKLKSSV
jgi:hypothetical protein